MSTDKTYNEVNNPNKITNTPNTELPIPAMPLEINFIKGVKFPNVKDKEFCVLGIRLADKQNIQYGVQFAFAPENEKKIRKIFKKLIPINPFQK